MYKELKIGKNIHIVTDDDYIIFDGSEYICETLKELEYDKKGNPYYNIVKLTKNQFTRLYNKNIINEMVVIPPKLFNYKNNGYKIYKFNIGD